MATTRILKTPSRTLALLSHVRSSADANKSAFGFLPAAAYEDQALQSKLWVAVDEPDETYCGHLLFGGRYPNPKVFQLFVAKERRGLRIGESMLNEFVEHASSLGCLTITARVAAELPASRFWERNGFLVVRTERKRVGARAVNLRVRSLDTPSLFDQPPSDLCFTDQPLLPTRAYALDVNILLDVVRDRQFAAEARQLLRAALGGHLRLVVAEEFHKELERHRQQPVDPLFELARDLPTVDPPDPATRLRLEDELRRLVFPDRTLSSSTASNDEADLGHLSTAIHQRLTGFVTREKALLRAGDKIRRAFGLDVLSTVDLANDLEPSSDDRAARVSDGQTLWKVSSASERDRTGAEHFLTSRGLPEEVRDLAWSSGSSAARRRRLVARRNGDIVAVASWDRPSRFTGVTKLFLFVRESSAMAETIIDHLLASALCDDHGSHARRVELLISSDQNQTHETALRRGFQPLTSSPHPSVRCLAKLVYVRPITEDDWPALAADCSRLTGLKLDSTMPTYSEFTNTGVLVTDEARTARKTIRLFEFETMISPGIALCHGRPALIVPIRSRFADGLIPLLRKQRHLFPDSEVRLHVEKAYFRSPRRTGAFERGTLVVFYVSGVDRGAKAATAIARVTSSKVCSAEEALLTMTRQGVLTKKELFEVANKQGLVHAFTFDNIQLFKRPVPYDELKNLGCVGGANLVTVEHLGPTALVQLISAANA